MPKNAACQYPFSRSQSKTLCLQMFKFGANLKRADPSMYRNHCFEPCQEGQICSGFALLQATGNPSMRCNPCYRLLQARKFPLSAPIPHIPREFLFRPIFGIGATFQNWRQKSKFARNEHRHHPLPEQVGVQPLANMRESVSPTTPWIQLCSMRSCTKPQTGRVGSCQKGAVTKEGECASALSA